MSNNNTIGSRVLRVAFFAVLFAVSGLASCGGGGGDSSPTPLTASLVPSRTSGVAPLAVFFDATNTTDMVVTGRPFHDLEYRWDFGDSAGGATWANGAQPGVSSKNTATGPVTSHVFETPGTYTVTLTAFDGAKTATTTTTITVTDPNTIFSATTVCIAATTIPSAGTDGCPAGAVGVKNADFGAELATQLAAGKRRVLLKHDDTFTSNGSTISTAGPGIIGAYGSGAAPIIGVSADHAIIKFSAVSDWRIMDIVFDGLATTTSTGVSDVVSSSNITVLRIAGRNLTSVVDMVSGSSTNWAIVDSNFTASSVGVGSGFGAYLTTGNGVALMGNYMDLGDLRPGTNHSFRTQGGVGLVFSNNTSTASGADALTIRGNTSYGVVADNKFVGASSTTLVTILPQNDPANEAQHDVIVERNWFISGSGTAGDLVVKAVGITIRNNIFNMSNASPLAVNVDYTSSAGTPMTDKIDIYNNTAYSNQAAATGHEFVHYTAGLTASCHSNIENNLVYMPVATLPQLIFNQGSCNVTGASGTLGNSSDAQIKSGTLLNFANSPPVNPVDFEITSGSYAINNGVSLPVWSDFLLVARPHSGHWDSGAFNGP